MSLRFASLGNVPRAGLHGAKKQAATVRIVRALRRAPQMARLRRCAGPMRVYAKRPRRARNHAHGRVAGSPVRCGAQQSFLAASSSKLQHTLGIEPPAHEIDNRQGVSNKTSAAVDIWLWAKAFYQIHACVSRHQPERAIMAHRSLVH